ncbi:translesion DNA synthesis-associated protein ImuA [Microbulbifer echini]|uniref:Translesion DNA synthesis-associated protein ImuA n=1 Tax=Microbulbifer echini TaxID=1529067 RepID=A0ABV4NNZ0_9GAMM
MNKAENLFKNNKLNHKSKPLLRLRRFVGVEANRTANGCGEPGIATGFASLDALLCGRGWPKGASVELLANQTGMNELSLLLPTLAELTRAQTMVVLIKPPFIPDAQLLAQYGVQLEQLLLVHPRGKRDYLWAIEQSLQSGGCGALLNWQGDRSMSYRELQRLQQATEMGDSLHFHFRPQSESPCPSPAKLRLQLKNKERDLSLRLLKQINGPSGQHLKLNRQRATPAERVRQGLH